MLLEPSHLSNLSCYVIISFIKSELLCYRDYLIYQIWPVMLLELSHFSNLRWLSHLSNLSCYAIGTISFFKSEMLCYWDQLTGQMWQSLTELLCYYLIYQIQTVMLLRLSHLSNLSCYVNGTISFFKYDMLCYWDHLTDQMWLCHLCLNLHLSCIKSFLIVWSTWVVVIMFD